MKKNKKAQVSNSIVPLVVGVCVAILVLIFVSSIGGQVWETVEDDVSTLGQTTAETRTQQNLSSSVSLDTDILDDTVVLTANGSTTISGSSIDNYFKVDYNTGTIYCNNSASAGSAGSMNTSYYNITYEYYNYTIRNSIVDSAVNSFTALEDTASYTPLIVLATIIGLVMVIILSNGFIGGGSVGGKGNAL